MTSKAWREPGEVGNDDGPPELITEDVDEELIEGEAKEDGQDDTDDEMWYDDGIRTIVERVVGKKRLSLERNGAPGILWPWHSIPAEVG